MLTQEQIKNLKHGDPLIVSGIFRRVDKDGDIWVNLDGDYFCFSPSNVSLPSEHGTSVPTPKHDPTRLFKEGDKVRVVEWNGRHFHDRDHGTELTTGCICEVDDDEEATSEHGVLVVYEEQVRCISPCFLELVTPVEELEPYYIETEDFDSLIYN